MDAENMAPLAVYNENTASTQQQDREASPTAMPTKHSPTREELLQKQREQQQLHYQQSQDLLQNCQQSKHSPSPAHINPFKARNSPTPGIAPFTLSNTMRSVVKYELIKGMHDARNTNTAPKPTPTLRKLLVVFRNAMALS